MPPQSPKIDHLPSDASAILRERYLAGTFSVVTQWSGALALVVKKTNPTLCKILRCFQTLVAESGNAPFDGFCSLGLPPEHNLNLDQSKKKIRQCTNPICHNASFCNKNVRMCAHLWYKMVYCRKFVWCFVCVIWEIYLLGRGPRRPGVMIFKCVEFLVQLKNKNSSYWLLHITTALNCKIWLIF